MATVARPKLEAVNCGGSSDECIAQLQAVTFCKLTEIVSSLLADGAVDGYALNGRKETTQQVMVGGSRAMPKLSDCDGRAEKCCVALAEPVPSSEESAVASPADLDQDIGVDEYWLQEAILLRREPLRRLRT